MWQEIINVHAKLSCLQKIKDELKTNASSVPCDLGGGANGHLGLVLTAAEYGFVSPFPYVRPVHPGNLAIPPGTPNYQATVLREDHKEAIRIFKEATNVKKSSFKIIRSGITITIFEKIL